MDPVDHSGNLPTHRPLAERTRCMAHNPLPGAAVGLAVANVKPSGSNCRQYGFPRALRRLSAVLVSSDASLTDRAISTLPNLRKPLMSSIRRLGRQRTITN